MKKYYLKKRKLDSKHIWLSIFIGLFVGFANGFFGGGGGMIVVPLLCFALGFKDKYAHASAIFVILPLCISSAVVYVCNGNYSINDTIFVGIGAVAGGIWGALLLKKLPNKALRIIFSILMIGVGVKMLF